MNLRSAVTNVAGAVQDVTGWGIPDNAAQIVQNMPAAPEVNSLGTSKTYPMQLEDLRRKVDDLAVELDRIRALGVGVHPDNPVYRSHELYSTILRARLANRAFIENCKVDMAQQKVIAKGAHDELLVVEAEAKTASGARGSELYNRAIALKATIEGAKYNHGFASEQLARAEAHKKRCGDLD